MPLTFPSHSAAVLPLLHLPGTRRLPPSALVVGSTAPDLIYLLGTHGADAHLPWGLLTFCLPAGLIAFCYLEGLLLPVLGPLLSALLPRSWLRLGRRALGPRPLPDRVGGWLAVGLAILLGAMTHQLWDGFTHAWMWPARTLYPGVRIALFGHPVLLSKLLQHLCSIVGAGVVLLYLGWTAPRASESAPPEEARAGAARQLRSLILLPLVAGAIAGGVRLRNPHPLFSRAIWDAAWSAVLWFVLVLGAACLLVRRRQLATHRSRTSRQQ